MSATRLYLESELAADRKTGGGWRSLDLQLNADELLTVLTELKATLQM